MSSNNPNDLFFLCQSQGSVWLVSCKFQRRVKLGSTDLDVIDAVYRLRKKRWITDIIEEDLDYDVTSYAISATRWSVDELASAIVHEARGITITGEPVIYQDLEDFEC